MFRRRVLQRGGPSVRDASAWLLIKLQSNSFTERIFGRNVCRSDIVFLVGAILCFWIKCSAVPAIVIAYGDYGSALVGEEFAEIVEGEIDRYAFAYIRTYEGVNCTAEAFLLSSCFWTGLYGAVMRLCLKSRSCPQSWFSAPKSFHILIAFADYDYQAEFLSLFGAGRLVLLWSVVGWVEEYIRLVLSDL